MTRLLSALRASAVNFLRELLPHGHDRNDTSCPNRQRFVVLDRKSVRQGVWITPSLSSPSSSPWNGTPDAPAKLRRCDVTISPRVASPHQFAARVHLDGAAGHAGHGRRGFVDSAPGLAIERLLLRGGVPEWLKGTDCKSVGARLRWFESNPLHVPATKALTRQEPRHIRWLEAPR